MEADGAPFTPLPLSVLRFTELSATRIKGKWKQTLKSPRIALGAPCSESRALSSSVTELRLQMLVFEERGKPEYPGKNLSEQSREPTNSTHIWRRIRESIPGHIGGRRQESRFVCGSQPRKIRSQYCQLANANRLQVCDTNDLDRLVA